MKKNWKSFAMGFLAAAILLGLALPAIAAGSTVNWDSVFVGVSIVIDGHKLDPRDVNGNQVDAVIYKGTTYLPVRAVAEALGLDVNWDQDTRTVYLGSGAPVKPEPQPEPEPEEEAAPAEEPEPEEEPAPAEEPEPEPAGDEQYVGKYRIKSMMGLPAEFLAALSEMEVDEFQELLVIELKADGTGIFASEDESHEFTWKVEGETLILSVDGEEISECGIKDGVISITMDGMTVELAK